MVFNPLVEVLDVQKFAILPEPQFFLFWMSKLFIVISLVKFFFSCIFSSNDDSYWHFDSLFYKIADFAVRTHAACLCLKLDIEHENHWLSLLLDHLKVH